MKNQTLFAYLIISIFSGLITPILAMSTTSGQCSRAIHRHAIAQSKAKKLSRKRSEPRIKRIPVSGERNQPVLQEEVLKQEFVDKQPHVEKKSWFKKHALKAAAGLVGAFLGYEWLSEKYPDTVPSLTLGVLKIINSVISWFGLGVDGVKVDQAPENLVSEKDIIDGVSEKVINAPVNMLTHQTKSTTSEKSTASVMGATLVGKKTVGQQSGNKPVTTIPTTAPTSTMSVYPVHQSTVQTMTMPGTGQSAVTTSPTSTVQTMVTDQLTTTLENMIKQPNEQLTLVVENTADMSGEGNSFDSLVFSGDEDSFETLSRGENEDSSVYYSALSTTASEDDVLQEKALIHSEDENGNLVEISPVIRSSTMEPQVIKEENKVVEKQLEPKSDDVEVVSRALDRLIQYTQNTGKWFLGLFDTKNNTSYNQYVDNFGMTIEQMEKEMNNVPVLYDNIMLRTTKEFASFLIRQLKETHKTLQGYKVSGWSLTPTGIKAGLLGIALQKHVDNKVKEERNLAMQNLRKEFAYYPELVEKVVQLQITMSDCGDAIEKKDQKTLLAGLTHRLNCK